MYARDCTPQITGAAIKAHRQIGPGLLESAYEACLAYELNKIELSVQRQKPVPLIYGNVKPDCGFRADLVVNGEVVVEIKCKDAFHPVDQAQLLSRLRLLDLRVGLLINFHVATLKEGIKRMVNNSQEAPETPEVRFARCARAEGNSAIRRIPQLSLASVAAFLGVLHGCVFSFSLFSRLRRST